MRDVPIAITGVAAGAILGVAAAGLSGYAIARAVTAPYRGRRFTTPVRGIRSSHEGPVVLLDDTAQTRQRGPYGAYLPDGTHVRFGTEAQSWGTLVARDIPPEAVSRISAIGLLSWTGIHFPTPESAGLDAEDIDLDTGAGPSPAWLIPGRSGRSWAVHIHGMGSTRAGTLRGARVAASLGLTSLVVTYRNSPEGRTYGCGRNTLGIDESDDVEAALEYAVAHGAERIILFGWSMGAIIALRLAHDPLWHERVVGIVADSPVLDWRATIAANLTAKGLPGQLARPSHPWLTRTVLSRTVGLDRHVDLEALDWTRPERVSTPMLILQGTEDRSTSWRVAARLASTSERIEIELFDADHTTTWNADPQRWQDTVSGWVSEQLRPGAGENA